MHCFSAIDNRFDITATKFEDLKAQTATLNSITQIEHAFSTMA